LFIVCTTLSFFGIQYWFGIQNTEVQKTQEIVQSEKLARQTKERGIQRVETPAEKKEIAANSNLQTGSGEQFYVLENEYQQLVVSARGGAISEINLPIRSPENQKSIVKEIAPDKQILEESPQNARFPLFPASS